MTLRTLSDIALALESEVKIYLAETVAAKNSSVWFTKNYVNFPVANQATHTETAKFETNVYSFPKFGQNNLLERTA